jgi:hypothetical protein
MFKRAYCERCEIRTDTIHHHGMIVCYQCHRPRPEEDDEEPITQRFGAVEAAKVRSWSEPPQAQEADEDEDTAVRKLTTPLEIDFKREISWDP